MNRCRVRQIVIKAKNLVEKVVGMSVLCNAGLI